MRIKITLGVETLPIIYRNRVLSLIKKALSESSKEYQEELYNNPIPKPFCFDLVIKDQEFRQEWLQLNQKIIVKESCFHFFKKKVDLIISSSDLKFMLHLIQGFKKIRYFQFSQKDTMKINNKEIVLEVLNISDEKEIEINSNEMYFKNYSGFIFNDANDKPVRVDDNNFHETLNKQVKRILSYYHNYELKEDLIFESINIKNAVIKHMISENITNDKPILFFSGNKGTFKLKGDKEALNLIYKNGFGNRTSQGFGMVHI